MIATWLDASRWTYNLTVEVLQSGIPAVWRHIAGMVMAELKVLKPEWESVPYQVNAKCRAMSNVKTFFTEEPPSRLYHTIWESRRGNRNAGW